MIRGSSPAGLCCSSAHLEQCGSDVRSWTWTKIWIQPRMPDYSLNWTARSTVIQVWHRCQWCSSPSQTCPRQSRCHVALTVWHKCQTVRWHTSAWSTVANHGVWRLAMVDHLMESGKHKTVMRQFSFIFYGCRSTWVYIRKTMFRVASLV